MRKEDIKVGDLLRTHERLVLVVSLKPLKSKVEGYLGRIVTVLDCGVLRSTSCVWLKPL